MGELLGGGSHQCDWLQPITQLRTTTSRLYLTFPLWTEQEAENKREIKFLTHEMTNNRNFSDYVTNSGCVALLRLRDIYKNLFRRIHIRQQTNGANFTSLSI